MRHQGGAFVAILVFGLLSLGCEDKIELKTFSVDPPEFSPDGDGVADTTKLTVDAQASVTEAHFKDSAMTFSESVYIDVKDSAGGIVTTSSQTQPLDRAGALKQGSLYALKTPKVDYSWNGKLPDGSYAPDGEYNATATAKLVGTKNGTPKVLDAAEAKTAKITVVKSVPFITAVSPADGSRLLYVARTDITVSVSDANGADVKLNGDSYSGRRQDGFIFRNVALKKGVNAFQVQATDAAGQTWNYKFSLESIQRSADGLVLPDEGGIVEVAEKASPIRGATVILYVGALSAPTTVSLAPAFGSTASGKAPHIPVGTPVRISPENTALNISADVFLPYDKELLRLVGSYSDELAIVKESEDSVVEVEKSLQAQRKAHVNGSVSEFGVFLPVALSQLNSVTWEYAGGGNTTPNKDGTPVADVGFDKPINSLQVDESGNVYVLTEDTLYRIDSASQVAKNILDKHSANWPAGGIATSMSLSLDGTVVYVAYAFGLIESFYLDGAGAVTGSFQVNGTTGAQLPQDGVHIRNIKFLLPMGILALGDDELVVVDSIKGQIYRVDREGMVHTIAGAGVGGKNEDEPHPAVEEHLTFPTEMEVAVIGKAAVGRDLTKVLFFADTIGNRIRAVNIGQYAANLFGTDLPPDYIMTVAGKKCELPGWLQWLCGGYSGDGGPAKGALLKRPQGVVYNDVEGSLVFADTGNNALRVVSRGGNISTLAGGSPVAGSVYSRHTKLPQPSHAALSFYNRFGLEKDLSGRVLVATDGKILNWTAEAFSVTPQDPIIKAVNEDIFFTIDFSSAYEAMSKQGYSFQPGPASFKCFKVACSRILTPGFYLKEFAPGFCSNLVPPGKLSLDNDSIEIAQWDYRTCRQRADDYYSSSPYYNLGIPLYDDAKKTKRFYYADTNGYNGRIVPGKDRWRFDFRFEKPDGAKKHLYLYVNTGAGLRDKALPVFRGVDISVFNEFADSTALRKVPDRVPNCDADCETACLSDGSMRDKSICSQYLIGQVRWPIDTSTGNYYPGTKTSISDAEALHTAMFSVDKTKGLRTALFREFINKMDEIGADTIGIQLRIGFMKAKTKGAGGLEQYRFFHAPFDSQTFEWMRDVIQMAGKNVGTRKGIKKFVVLPVWNDLYKSVPEGSLDPVSLANYSKISYKMESNLYQFKSQGGGIIDDEQGTDLATFNLFFDGPVDVEDYDVKYKFENGEWLNTVTPKGGRLHCDATDCGCQRILGIYNYKCLITSLLESVKDLSNDNEIYMVLANDYTRVVSKMNDTLADMKTHCPNCKFEGAMFALSFDKPVVRDFYLLSSPSQVPNVGINLGFEVACVDPADNDQAGVNSISRRVCMYNMGGFDNHTGECSFPWKKDSSTETVEFDVDDPFSRWFARRSCNELGICTQHQKPPYAYDMSRKEYYDVGEEYMYMMFSEQLAHKACANVIAPANKPLTVHGFNLNLYALSPYQPGNGEPSSPMKDHQQQVDVAEAIVGGLFPQSVKMKTKIRDMYGDCPSDWDTLYEECLGSVGLGGLKFNNQSLPVEPNQDKTTAPLDIFDLPVSEYIRLLFGKW
ncbi:MAG: hypothetical protein HY897_22770 [Deltaproteobacteria bacterium]|nr:hypothetical protein [Deltaproteobacteria bacterium]